MYSIVTALISYLGVENMGMDMRRKKMEDGGWRWRETITIAIVSTIDHRIAAKPHKYDSIDDNQRQ
jgi:hypothetical protein